LKDQTPFKKGTEQPSLGLTLSASWVKGLSEHDIIVTFMDGKSLLRMTCPGERSFLETIESSTENQKVSRAFNPAKRVRTTIGRKNPVCDRRIQWFAQEDADGLWKTSVYPKI